MNKPALAVVEAAHQPIADSAALFADADAYLPGAALGAYSLPDDIRLVFSHARGSKMWDVDGREFIDYVGGAGALILGHAHPAVVAAAQQQLARGAHVFGSLTQPAIDLAKRLVRAIPCAEKIVYATTGSEATAYAMRLARAFTGRDKILKFAGAYHGNHDYALVSAFPAGDAAADEARADSAGQPAATTSTVLVAPYNDLDAVKRIIAEHGRDLAAVIVEGVQRIIPARAEFLHGLRKMCDANDSLLILDEVVTGFRLGAGGAQGWHGVEPDLATYGKVIGAGGPLSCIAGRADVIEQANPRRKGDAKYTYFNGTLHGNPVAAAATMALLDELTPEVYARLNRATEDLCRECQAVLDAHNLPAIACNTGSLWQIVFADAPPVCQADLAAGAADNRRLDAALMKRGQYVLPGVRRFVSAAHTGADFEDTVRGLDAACRDFNRA